MKQIKIALKDIKPNPFKKEIDGGRLNEEQIETLIEGYKQTTFHENLLARKNDKGQVELVYGHHRLESAKRVYGKNHVISLNLVDYNDEQMIIDLCRENLTQRFNEFRQEKDAVLLSKKWLERAGVHLLDTRDKTGRINKASTSQGVGSRQIAEFLSKDGKALCKSKVADILRMVEKLDSKVLDKVSKFSSGGDVDEGVTYKQAVALSQIEDKKEQTQILQAMKKSKEEFGGRPHELIAKYKEAPEEIKERVRTGKLDLQDVANESEILTLKKKIDEGKQEQDQKIQIIRAREIVDTLRSDILDTHRQLDSLMYKIGVVRKKGFGWYTSSSKKDFKKLVSNVLNKVEKWRDELLQIQEEIGD